MSDAARRAARACLAVPSALRARGFPRTSSGSAPGRSSAKPGRRPDRHARRAHQRRSLYHCLCRSAGPRSIPRAMNSCASRSRRRLPPSAKVLVYGSWARASVPMCQAPAIGCSRRLELAGGAVVVVNRGFLPEGHQDPKTHMPPAGHVDVGSERCVGPSRVAGSCPMMIRRAISGSRAISSRWRGPRAGATWRLFMWSLVELSP